MLRDPPPDRLCLLLAGLIFIEPRIAPAVIDVGPRLAPRRTMHIKNHIEMIHSRPFDNSVDQPESLFILLVKQSVMKRDSNRVESRLGQKVNVPASDVSFPILVPELARLGRSYQLVHHRLNLSRRLRSSL